MKRPAWRTIAKVGLYSAAGIAGTVLGTASFLAWTLIRPNRDSRFDCVHRIRYGTLEPFELFTSDGLRLHAWILLSQVATGNNWVLLLHGYRSDRAILQTRARFFSRRGFHVMLLHFRGHGASTQATITYGMNERKDVLAAFEFIHSFRTGVPVSIGIDGISMGAAAAAYSLGIEKIEPDWVILESCYDNIRHALANRLAVLVGRPLTPVLAWPVEWIVEYLAQLRAEDLDPAKALEHARCPVLVLAGDADQVLKSVEIEYLYGAIPGPKQLGLFAGAGHEDLLLYDPKRYSQLVDSFLRTFADWKGRAHEPLPYAPEELSPIAS